MPDENGTPSYAFEAESDAWFAKVAEEARRERGESAKPWTNTLKPVDLVGTAEAAEILGVERPRIGRWIKRGQMPQPVAKLQATPVWRRRDVEAMSDQVEARRRAPAGSAVE